jgi:hypothetical protein
MLSSSQETRTTRREEMVTACRDGKCMERAATVLRQETAQSLGYVTLHLALLASAHKNDALANDLNEVREDVRAELSRILEVVEKLERGQYGL